MAFNIKETLELFGNQVTYSQDGGTQRSYNSSGNLIFDADGKSIKLESDESASLSALFIGPTEWAIGSSYSTGNINTGLISIPGSANGTNWTALNISNRNVLWTYDNTASPTSSYSEDDEKYPLFLSTKKVDLTQLGTHKNVVIAAMQDAIPDKSNALFLQEARFRSSLNLTANAGNNVFLSDIDTNVEGRIDWQTENLTTATTIAATFNPGTIELEGEFDGYLTAGTKFAITGGTYDGTWTVTGTSIIVNGNTRVQVVEPIFLSETTPAGSVAVPLHKDSLYFGSQFSSVGGGYFASSNNETGIGVSNSSTSKSSAITMRINPNANDKSQVFIQAQGEKSAELTILASEPTGPNQMFIKMDTDNPGIEVYDMSERGAHYSNDYSTQGILTYGDRWITDKGWVDGAIQTALAPVLNDTIDHKLTFDRDIEQDSMYLIWGNAEIDTGTTINNDGRFVIVNGTFTNNGVYNQGTTGSLDLVRTNLSYILNQGNETTGNHLFWTDSLGAWTAGDSTSAISLQASNAYVTKEWVRENSIWAPNSNGIHYNSGDVGIGTANPSSKLELYSAGNTTSLDNTLRFRDNDTVITSFQEQFIGKIEFYSNENSGPGVKSYIAGIQGANADGAIIFATTEGTGGSLVGSNPQDLIGEKMRIDALGNVGIGTSAPDRELHVKGLGSILKLETTEALGRNYLEFSDAAATKGYIGYGSSANDNFIMANFENGAKLQFLTTDALGNSDTALVIDEEGEIEMASLSGTGTRMVVADGTGVLSTQAITGNLTIGDSITGGTQTLH